MKYSWFESFTGTGAIAITPGPYDITDEEDEDEDANGVNDVSEKTMTRRQPVIREWDPKFSGGEYDPGDYQMPSPTGDGVAERKPKKDKVGAYDTATSNQGKEWVRDHKDTPAMSDVNDDGVCSGPQGSHESSVGDPKDGHQEEMGHNWPDEAKNTGSGVAEPFEGNRWSDGGTLQGGSAQDEMDNAGTPQKMPTDGPITGTSPPQMGQPNESWSPELFGKLIDEDVNLQGLFDSYARETEAVCLEDFERLCAAHGADYHLDVTSILQLMRENREFIFYEGEDANGIYWVPTPLAEGKPFPGAAPPINGGSWDGDSDEGDDGDDSGGGDSGDSGGSGGGKPWESGSDDSGSDDSGSDDGGSDDDDDDGGGNDSGCKPWESGCSEGRERPFGRTFSELQEREPGIEAIRGSTLDREEDAGFGEFGAGGDPFGMDIGAEPDVYGGDPDLDPEYGERLGASRGMDAMTGPGHFGMHGSAFDECPECGYLGPEEDTCPECGGQLGFMGGEEGIPSDMGMGGPSPGFDTEEDIDASMDYEAEMDEMGGPPLGPEDTYSAPDDFDELGLFDEEGEESELEESRVFSPRNHKSIREFLVSARNIIGRNQGAGTQSIGEALTKSWQYYAGNINPRRAPSKVQASLQQLMNKFPTFQPLSEALTLGSDTKANAMEKMGGTQIGGAGGGPNNPSHFLAEKDQPGPDDGKELGEPLGKSQKNNLEGTPTIDGTEKKAPATVKENVSRLAKHVRKSLTEAAGSLRGKFGIAFTCLVKERDGSVNRTSPRRQLSEALADVEELLQMHPVRRVVLEAYFMEGKNVRLTHRVPMIPVRGRMPLSEGNKALFRFGRHAEAFANNMVAEGHTCRVLRHNWGSAVRVEEGPYLPDDEGAEMAVKGRRREKPMQKLNANVPFSPESQDYSRMSHGVGAEKKRREGMKPRPRR